MPSPHTWILIRGLTREKNHWGDFLPKFRERFPGDEVLAVDLPGFGDLRDQTSPRTIAEIFNIVRSQAIDQAKTQNQFRLVAISLGGMVAMEWMRRDAQSLDGCVLINTSSRGHSPFYRRLRWQIWGQFLRAVAITSPKEREKVILDFLLNKEEAKAEALPLWVKIAKEHPVSYLNFVNQMAAAASFKGLEGPPQVPVLLLNSLGDRMVEPSCSEELQKAWGCPMERHPWAGHELTWDDPEWVLDKIKTWNDSNSALA